MFDEPGILADDLLTESVSEFEKSYIPPNLAQAMREYQSGRQGGTPSHIQALDRLFTWRGGTLCGLYGWPGDGKGTMFDFAALTKTMFEKEEIFRVAMLKPEDMTNSVYKGKVEVSANNIYDKLVWMKTGKCTDEAAARRMKIDLIPKDLYFDELDFIKDRFKVLLPSDMRFKSIRDNFMWAFEKWGLKAFQIDTYKDLTKEGGEDELNSILKDYKKFALETNTSCWMTAHPKTMRPNEMKDKTGAYVVITQYLVSGGAPWDNNMDYQCSIYKPGRHLKDFSDTRVQWHTLKVRDQQLMGCYPGQYDEITFERETLRYFFDSVCPLDGSRRQTAHDRKAQAEADAFTTSKKEKEEENETGLPF